MARQNNTHESIDVLASIDWTYAAWIEFTKIPLNDVDPNETGGRFRWEARGVLGYDDGFDAEITQNEPNQLIAWRGDGGRSGRVEGRALFIELAPAETRVEVSLSSEAPDDPATSGSERSSSPQGLREELARFKRQAESASPDDFTQTTAADAGDVPRTPAGASVASSLAREGSSSHRDAVTDDIARAAGLDERELREQGLRPPAS